MMRVYLTILSSCNPNDFAHMVSTNDTTSLVRIPGIGKKTAERLIIEIRDKLNHLNFNPSETLDHDNVSKNVSRKIIIQDAIAALVSLGYKYPDATKWIAKIDDGFCSSQDLIRRALKELFV